MKQAISVFVVMAMLLSIVPISFADGDNGSSVSGNSDNDDTIGNDDVRTTVREKVKTKVVSSDGDNKVKIMTRTKLKDISKENGSVDRSELKIKYETRLKLIKGEDEAGLKAVEKLSDAELRKFNALSRAGLKAHLKLSDSELKESLKNLKLVNVKKASDLSEGSGQSRLLSRPGSTLKLQRKITWKPLRR